MNFLICALFSFIFIFMAERARGFVPLSHTSSRGSVATRSSGADIEQETEPPVSKSVDDDEKPTANRGKVNEIDFCLAPADVSLSRSYSAAATTSTSLTRALNNASNRAVRRILLARSWPSAEALNRSLRQSRAAEVSQKSDIPLQEENRSKCPVPRPILNILVRRRGEKMGVKGDSPEPRSRTDEEYVEDQLKAFRDRYGTIPGFACAEAYLECILSLATSGLESPRVSEVMETGVYDESYRRILAVLKSVGAVFEKAPDSEQLRIGKKLVDQDVCLSILDKMNLKRERLNTERGPRLRKEAEKDDAAEEQKDAPKIGKQEAANKESSKVRLVFWRKEEEVATQAEQESEEDFELDPNDLGGVLLSAEEPSITRQLNVLSNIVQRALLFGGDQELVVLSETLDADTPAFVNRWYPGVNGEVALADPAEETRAGVQYLNCLVELLKICYRDGVIITLQPPLPLSQSYQNSYDRLVGSLVELGSGYVKPVSDVMTMPVPRTAQEELGRFAVWESTFRSKNKPDVNSYPEDLIGSWEVKDEIGGETIGVSTVVFRPNGEVDVAPPMQGLRWRLDPGPTHLDTCTFQVLGEDRTILQYRGFIDRGARLEARFSKRRMTIRGSVMFQMRDGESVYLGDDYWKDMLPVNYKTGTTKFVMAKNSD